MNRFIALYRGINVGGRNIVKMASLRAMHERLDHREVATYIQSGNVAFSAGGAATSIARQTASAFLKEFGFEAQVMVVAANRWRRLIRENPYAAICRKDPTTVHAAISDGEPSEPGLAALRKKTGGSESFVVIDDVVYLHAPDGIAGSKFLTGMEKACKARLTVRNWRTVEAIRGMLEPADGLESV